MTAPPSARSATALGETRAEWEQLHLALTTVIEEIRYAREESLRAADRIEDAVRAARNQSVPWSTIGSAAGMSRQAAQKRWSS